ncbi:hypothetical protein BDN67DRAFT_1016853 [Paxillus ammoniavirescens]|nr:hypothetical protein BDN67DRAFT_1016853 [Paxillus ammoniavirescens]
MHTTEDGQLGESRVWWSQRYQWLKDNGYLLRPRYASNWPPSWQGTKSNWATCEESLPPDFPSRIPDAMRLSDGKYVTLKLVKKTDHPHEIDIAQFFSFASLAGKIVNYYVPIHDVLPIPGDEERVIIIMTLGGYNNPPFDTVGEALECFQQLFGGPNFMHKHRVAHRRDSMSRNIMVDASSLYDSDPTTPEHLLIDFGLSRRYDHSVAKPLKVSIRGSDKDVQEFRNSGTPCDPFSTDVFYFGYAIRNALVDPMVQRDPSKRPTMDEVMKRFDTIQAGLRTWQLRSRVVDKR